MILINQQASPHQFPVGTEVRVRNTTTLLTVVDHRPGYVTVSWHWNGRVVEAEMEEGYMVLASSDE